MKSELSKVWGLIPDFECKQDCHECCGPISWSPVEDIVIQEYMKEHNIKDVHWTTEQYIENKLLCPYIINNKCIIYPVRPIVCRLQGHIPELPCPYNKNYDVSRQTVDKIYREMKKLHLKLI